ncbi:MAG: hypothetical protein DM484_01020, partial [Candidatus Methylumidiphilus alinenensis]
SSLAKASAFGLLSPASVIAPRLPLQIYTLALLLLDSVCVECSYTTVLHPALFRGTDELCVAGAPHKPQTRCLLSIRVIVWHFSSVMAWTFSVLPGLTLHSTGARL